MEKWSGASIKRDQIAWTLKIPMHFPLDGMQNALKILLEDDVQHTAHFEDFYF